MMFALSGRTLTQAAAALVALVSILLAVLSIAPTAPASASATTTATTATSMSAAETDTYERKVQYRVNQVRAQRGLPRLRLAACTDQVAERWNRHLTVTGEFYHQSMADVLDRCDATYAGETLGRGGMTPQRLVQLWMDSEPHRVVLMSTKSRRIGIGAEYDASGRWVVTANFMRF